MTRLSSAARSSLQAGAITDSSGVADYGPPGNGRFVHHRRPSSIHEVRNFKPSSSLPMGRDRLGCSPSREGAVRARTQAFNHLQAWVTTAPETLHTDEQRGTSIALRATARRIQSLDAELEPLVRALASTLLHEQWCALGRTRDTCAPKPHSRTSPESLRSPHRQAKQSATASTDAATASSIVRSTVPSSFVGSTTKRLHAMSNAGAPKGRQTARLGVA